MDQGAPRWQATVSQLKGVMPPLVRRQARRLLGSRLTDRIVGVPVPDPATDEDLVSTYRVLLDRDPDAGARRHWDPQLPGLTRADLVTLIAGSREFRASRLYRRIADLVDNRDDLPATTVTSGRGLTFLVDPRDNAIGIDFDKPEGYEPHVTRRILECCQPGATVLDVGANIGWYTVNCAAAVGPTGRVVAVEPGAANVSLLLRSVSANRFDNVVTLPVALSDRAGIAILQREYGSNGALFPNDRRGTPSDQLVSVLTLDLLEGVFDRLDVMKIDVEGIEPLVLRGGESLLSKHRPVVFMEFTPGGLDRFPGSSLEALGEWTEAHGYTIEVIDTDGALLPADTIRAAATLVESRGWQHADIKLIPT